MSPSGAASAPGAVLVTGGGTGIGAAVARMLTASGARVAICGRRPGPLRDVAAETGALDITCDVADPEAVGHLVAAVTGEFGRLDGLVLNAGVIFPGGVAELSPADFATMMSANLTGAFLVARAALPALLDSRGAIVSVASIAALRAASDMGGYAATKAGLAMLTQSLAVDHAHQGLRANVVCPGWTITEMADAEMTAFGAERGPARHRRLRPGYRAGPAAAPGHGRRGRRRRLLAAVARRVIRQRGRHPGGRLGQRRRCRHPGLRSPGPGRGSAGQPGRAWPALTGAGQRAARPRQRSVITLPVISAASSEARYAITPATSSGVATWIRLELSVTAWRTESVTQPVSVTGG